MKAAKTALLKCLCYTLHMPRIVERWLLFKYIGGELTPLSTPLKKKEQAEKARQKYPERERKTIGIGLMSVFLLTDLPLPHVLLFATKQIG